MRENLCGEGVTDEELEKIKHHPCGRRVALEKPRRWRAKAKART
ncbi:MAG: hypothetical protein ACLRSW_05750 [Christensenellaceae bacterium]